MAALPLLVPHSRTRAVAHCRASKATQTNTHAHTYPPRNTPDAAAIILTAMKALIITFLLAAGMANAANQYCSGDINSNMQVNSTSAASTNIGSRCRLAPNRVLTLSGADLPQSGSLPATSTFEDGTVGSGGALIVQGPSFEVAANCIPFIVTVKKNKFEVDAALRFAGSLPPSSIVTISDNELNNTKPHPAFGYDDRVVAILLGDSEPMYLCAKSQLTIMRNVVCAINPCQLLLLAAFAIACFVQILLQLAACCRCCENNCTAEVPCPTTTTRATTTVENVITDATEATLPTDVFTTSSSSSTSTTTETTTTPTTTTETTTTPTTTTPTTTTETTTTPTTTTPTTTTPTTTTPTTTTETTTA